MNVDDLIRREPAECELDEGVGMERVPESAKALFEIVDFRIEQQPVVTAAMIHDDRREMIAKTGAGPGQVGDIAEVKTLRDRVNYIVGSACIRPSADADAE